MRLFRFGAETGKPITQFGSLNVALARLVQLNGAARVDCMVIGPNGVVGYHPASGDQLFLVVQGEGIVRAGEDAPVVIRAGEAAFWQAGELHETTSEAGLTAIVIEAEQLDPARFMLN